MNSRLWLVVWWLFACISAVPVTEVPVVGSAIANDFHEQVEIELSLSSDTEVESVTDMPIELQPSNINFEALSKYLANQSDVVEIIGETRHPIEPSQQWNISMLRTKAEALFQTTYFKRKLELNEQELGGKRTFFKADKTTYYMLQSEEPIMRSATYGVADYLGLDLQNGKTLVMRHSYDGVSEFEEACYDVQGMMEHKSFKEYPVLGTRWMPIVYIPGRPLSEEMADKKSTLSKKLLYRKAKMALHQLHTRGYYHGSAYVRNFIVNPQGDVFLTNYRTCGMIRPAFGLLNPGMISYYSDVKEDYRQLALYMPLYFYHELFAPKKY